MSGIKYENHKGERVAVIDRSAIRQEAIKGDFNRFLKMSNIPPRYWTLDFGDYIGTKSLQAVELAKKYVDKVFTEGAPATSLYLYGERRCQKTMIACAIGKGLLRRGFRVQFAQAGDIGDMLLKTQGYGRDEKLSAWKQMLRAADVLIIDEAFDINKTVMWVNSESKNLIVADWDRLIRGMLSEGKAIIAVTNHLKTSIGINFSKDLYELVDSEFLTLTFEDSVKDLRKQQMQNFFEA